jgi:hypothetical protein
MASQIQSPYPKKHETQVANQFQDIRYLDTKRPVIFQTQVYLNEEYMLPI